jgi:hypothetical protein
VKETRERINNRLQTTINQSNNNKSIKQQSINQTTINQPNNNQSIKQQ